MAEQDPSIGKIEKVIDWSSSIGVTMPVSEVEVYQRVEKIEPFLMDNGELRIQALIKLFAVLSSDLDQKHIFKPAKIFTNEVELTSFINFSSKISREDILSIDHQAVVKNYAIRPGHIIISGTLKLNINYVLHLVLDGTVTDFANNSPINGANISVKDIESSEVKAATNTGSNGRYFFNNLPPGVYLIEAQTDSHVPEHKVSVIKTRDTVNFVLHQ